MYQKYDPLIHHRRSIRLKNYDYSQPSAYFVTICTQNKECILGKISNNELFLTGAGIMIQNTLNEIPAFYPGVDVDENIVMPNHIHIIIVLFDVGATPCGCPDDANVGATPRGCPDDSNISKTGQAPKTGQARGPAPTLSLPDIVQRFKSLTTTRYIKGVKEKGWKPFDKKIWQKNYYEHIIRNEDDLHKIREYILYNPLNWNLDEENPNFTKKL